MKRFFAKLWGILTIPARIVKASKRFWELDEIYRATLSEMQLKCMFGDYRKDQTDKIREFLENHVATLTKQRNAIREAERLRSVTRITRAE